MHLQAQVLNVVVNQEKDRSQESRRLGKFIELYFKRSAWFVIAKNGRDMCYRWYYLCRNSCLPINRKVNRNSIGSCV